MAAMALPAMYEYDFTGTCSPFVSLDFVIATGKTEFRRTV
jgi:hypothetical protein